ncbi:hypothetical protein KCU71_g66, partial [Aureobasidium melanogenum]
LIVQRNQGKLNSSMTNTGDTTLTFEGMLVETDLDLKLTGCSGAGSSRKDGVSQLQQRQGTGKLDRLSTRKNS